MAGAGLGFSSSLSAQSRATAGIMVRIPVPLLKRRKLKFAGLNEVFRIRVAGCGVSSTRLYNCGSCAAEERVSVDMERYKEAFGRRMAVAGLKPHHSIAVGVSGGPDSMALCLLTAAWKTDGPYAASQSDGYVDGLLAIIVDHRLRAESKEEAHIVSRRVSKMGAFRYQIFQKVCIQHQIDVLLIAHHADDQAELLILRLSRGSGVLGLAGMAFASQLFSTSTVLHNEGSNNKGLLLVRPLLHFSKEDMYKICQASNQDWVEDPTNRSPAYARNRIRMSLGNLSSYTFQSEIQELISSCRKTRAYVDHMSNELIDQAVNIMDQGYAVIDLMVLSPSKVPDMCLSKFIALVLQTSFTVAGCYLCPSPGSRGTKLLVCCSVNCHLPSTIEVNNSDFDREQKQYPSMLDEIIAEGKSYVDQFVPDVVDVKFLDMTCQSVLAEAKRIGIISESTHNNITLLERNETKYFKPENKVHLEQEIIENPSTSASESELLHPGKACYFMDRFMVTWNERPLSYCSSLVIDHRTAAEVRYMAESDWLYLAKLARCKNLHDLVPQITDADSEVEQIARKRKQSLEYMQLSAIKSLQSLKSIPVAARRSLPVLVNHEGILLTIPSIGFQCCPCLIVSCAFRPRLPLGGGHSSFL
ncbi:unnamed protein product [Linum tenue]|uniref:tRNA(Ile)-lysidine synthetase n=1 Tax=Linum tenue TaxID=586396 RepID=A0AAV0S6T3_9ROSI|nr:unnamed protein product [Linum tenue]